MRETFELKVHIACDEETGRWYVTESDIPGLWLEADDAVALIARVQEAAPELIELNLDEIIEACLEKAATEPKPCDRQTFRPSLRPVFDSPLMLAHA